MNRLGQLYRAAIAEAELNLWASGPSSLWHEAIDRFQARFRGIEVHVESGYSGALVAAIDRQRAAGAVEADLAILQSVDAFERWAEQGALEPCAPAGIQHVPPAFRHSAGAYFGVQINGVLYAGNENIVEVDDLPRSALDFLDERFRGLIVSGDPRSDEVVLYLYSLLVERYGWSFVDRLIANEVTFVVGHGPLSQRLAAGESGVTFDAVPSLLLGRQNVRVYPPAEEPMPVWAQLAGAFTAARHPRCAELFLNWLLSTEHQTQIARNGTWPARSDIPQPGPLRPLSEYWLADGFAEFVLDEPRMIELRSALNQRIETRGRHVRTV